ncbi:MAG: cytochrome c [Gemmatimonadetes bacterium]|nr:cytochrome c [Gemmatimonadota bacterium]NNM04428.1 cytochrome c [Gemmatimonadota bacterium]
MIPANWTQIRCWKLAVWKTSWIHLPALVLPLVLFGCGGGGGDGEDTGSQAEPGATVEPGSDLTEWELENGIGPVTEPLALGDIDPGLVAQGEEIFNLKCSACHKLDQRYVAPPLRDVTSRRTPEFVMNMLLNPLEMTQRHPATKELLAEYYTPMTPQGLTNEDARAILDFLRQALADGPAGGG